MSRAYDLLFDRVLTRVDPERAHHTAFRAIRAAGPVLRRRMPVGTPRRLMGIDFGAPLGLAAGFDKNAEGIDALAGFGFGFVEIGTVTGEAQPGNPRPRMARLPQDRAIVNRMGFNNDGAEVVAARLHQRRRRLESSARSQRASVPLGVNIGKTKVVPEGDQAAVIADHEKSAGLLAPYADYLVVNVSSPNTPGLRTLQATDRLRPLLQAVRRRAEDSAQRPVPLLVKIAPDLADEDVVDVARMALDISLDGIIATNTTIARGGLRSPAPAIEAAGAGGLSGAPLRTRSTGVLRLLREQVGTRMVLIGAGGIDNAQDAIERLDAGADLLQAYTGFVYGGPGWPRAVNRSLERVCGHREERG